MRAALGQLRPSGPDAGRGVLATGLYALFCALTANLAAGAGHPEAWLAMLAVPVAIAARFRVAVLAVGLVIGGAWLRLVFGSFIELGADQVPVVQAAVTRVLEGGNPYGVGYAESDPPGAPFVYGPLMLLWGWTGTWGEAVASIGTLVLLAATRSWLTLALFGTFPLFIIITMIGINDSTPGFLITAALLALRWRPVVAGALLAVAIAFKPYALAWLPGLLGYGGLAAATSFVAVSAVAWSPVLVWGPQSVLRSVELAAAVHSQSPGGGLGVPALRILAAPVALAALLVRRWTVAVLSGTAVFVLVLFTDFWASVGYWLAVLPITGVCVEAAMSRWWARRASERRSAGSSTNG